jgi:hypothetical protein
MSDGITRDKRAVEKRQLRDDDARREILSHRNYKWIEPELVGDGKVRIIGSQQSDRYSTRLRKLPFCGLNKNP